jgi:hypothetical protein
MSAPGKVHAASLAISALGRNRRTLLPSDTRWRIFAFVEYCQTERDMKGLEKKKEAKKKPQKSLKEKRAEKQAKKADRS